MLAKDLIETVDEPLILHQRRSGEEVEGLDIEIGKPCLHSPQKVQKLPESDRDFRLLQLEEEGDEHGNLPNSDLAQIIMGGLVDLVNPVAEKQVGMATPAVLRRKCNIIMREIIVRHLDGHARIHIAEIFIRQ